MKKIKLKKVGNDKRKLKNLILILIAIGGIGIASLILVFALYIIIASPDFDRELLYSKEATVVYNIEGEEIARIGSENRALVTYDELPQVLIDALIATEDSRFFQHNGLDAARFLKASFGQFLGQDGAGGASTLSMQVIKNTYTDNTASGIKGIIRKFTDIYMSIFKLESNYTKEEIIEFYVNSQWLGNDGNLNYTGIHGVEQASQYYFGKSVADLNLSEASLLVGMFQNPAVYNPYTNPKNATKRRSTVLSLMVKHGYITKDEKDAAEAISIPSMLTSHEDTASNEMQAFIDYLLKDVEEKTGSNPYTTPMKIYSTLDSKAQAALTDLENGKLYTFKDNIVQIGVAVTSVKDGSIVALSGGRNYSAKGLNRATDINRHPGSTAKPIVDYGPYIEFLDGSSYSLFLDEPTTYSNGTSISNYDNKYKGLLTMRDALEDSRNIPALLAFKAVAKDFKQEQEEFIHNLGINFGDTLYESAAIGGFEGVSPLELSAAYSTFGRGGYYIEPYAFTKVEYLDSSKTYEYKYTKERVMSEETADIMNFILTYAGASNVGGNFKISGTDIAAKTGTTTVDKQARKEKGLPDNVVMDYWNITYSPDYAIALWYGYDNLSKDHYLQSESGVRKRLMEAIAKKIYKKNSRFKKSSGVVSVEIEKETFPPQLASEFTPEHLRTTELFKKGTEPTDVSQRFSQLANPTNAKYTFDGSTIKLTWDAVEKPNAINPTYLQNHFNTYYGNYAAKYYDARIAYNNSTIGELGYQIYLKNADGTLSSLGYTYNNDFTYTTNVSGTYTFVIKTTYSIFKNNISSGVTVEANASIDSNVSDIVTPPTTP
ncbi:MAG: transglycosylase domain-containing protein [Bacilli bacterium]|nr:transglycosylase domain-containing protein [Bacilli bacterium]